ncbi:fungal-specific transcription factor domain-containing protein [Exophiala viscosa]|uniref:Fungal-specific transcription factor domain-containing protein n=1 Tax=Exophiala viscosa TaxID=2486360 RepID=A0AAN6DKL7_9EURO|nr:fungal-specific transcription factor domain-containing protein [Exophiala viscosa]
MAPHSIRRQPISCENCRNRKIKCTGGRAPCQSCVRRGFGASCYFVRSVGPSRDTTLYEDLVDRIAGLESLLRQHINVDVPCHRNTILQTPTGGSSDASTSSNVGASDESFSVSSFPLTGSLLKSKDGYVRFIPHMEHFNSEDMAAFMHTENSSPLTTSTGFPFSAEPAFPRQTLLELLPSKRQCDELLQRYHDVFSPLFHILHDPTLHNDYAEFCKSPGQLPLAFLALLFVILAIAVLTLEDNDPLLEELSREGTSVARIRSIASRYRQAAIKCLTADQFMLQHNLYTVKALLLLIYANSHTDGPTWPLLGLTLHIATAIGCHIDPRLLDVGTVEAEERRRCWAGLKMLYQNQATCMGNLLPNPVSADVDLPADVNDDEITENGVHNVCGGPYSTRAPTQMTYILYKFRLYTVATAVCKATLNLLPLQSPLLRSLDARIAQEQSEHTRRFSNFPDLPLHQRANMEILKNYSNQLYLILHRPYLKGSCLRLHTSEAVDVALLKKSRSQCKDAAMAILDSHRQLYENAGFRRYDWYVYRLGSFNAFLGASTLLALLLDPQLLQLTDEEYSFILAMVQGCTQRLESMSERSEVCAKASPILRRILGTAEQHARTRTRQEDNMLETMTTRLSFGVVQEPDLTSSSITSFTHDPTSSVDLDGWTMHPELNAIMSHFPPEQWLGPSAFNWDRCWSPAVVQSGTLIPNSWG